MDILDTIVAAFAKNVTDETSEPQRPHLMTVSDATLVFSTTRLQQVQHVHQLDEETITAALLGSLATAFPFCAEIIGNDADNPTTCYWSQFKKTKPSADRPQDHEATSGADFALAIRVGDDDLRLALFQAKRSKKGGDEIDVHQRVAQPREPGKDWRDAQIVALAKFGKNLMEHIGCQQHALEDLKWVHYVGYHQDVARCLPLARLRDAYLVDDVPRAVSKNMVSVLPTDPTFLEVLLASMHYATLQHEAKWLRLTKKQAEDHLPDLIDLTTLYLLDETRGEGALELADKVFEAKATAIANRHKREAEAAERAKPQRTRTHSPR
jgi:hypothetical protein